MYERPVVFSNNLFIFFLFIGSALVHKRRLQQKKKIFNFQNHHVCKSGFIVKTNMHCFNGWTFLIIFCEVFGNEGYSTLRGFVVKFSFMKVLKWIKNQIHRVMHNEWLKKRSTKWSCKWGKLSSLIFAYLNLITKYYQNHWSETTN